MTRNHVASGYWVETARSDDSGEGATSIVGRGPPQIDPWWGELSSDPILHLRSRTRRERKGPAHIDTRPDRQNRFALPSIRMLTRWPNKIDRRPAGGSSSRTSREPMYL